MFVGIVADFFSYRGTKNQIIFNTVTTIPTECLTSLSHYKKMSLIRIQTGMLQK